MKVAIVTGSTSNIGKAIAEALARDDHHVVITSRKAEEAAAVAAALPKPGTGMAVDFGTVADIEKLFAFVRAQFGRVDVLVNNVAYTKNESILDCDLETWDQTIQTNLRS